MKKVVLIIAFIVPLFCLFLLFCKTRNTSENIITLNIYNWGEFISNGTDNTLDVNSSFTKQTGIKVNYTTFQSNEAMLAKLLSGSTKYDVVIPSDYMVAKLIEKDMLRALNLENIPNNVFVDNEFKNPEYDPNGYYSLPYVWGLIGIFYNKIIVNEKEENIDWDILWNPKYKGKILMFDNPRDAFAISQLKLGIPLNTKNENDWYRAKDELKRQKPLVAAYVMDQIFDKMASGDAAIAPYYAGDAAILMNKNENLSFVIPKQGTNRFVDALCIPKNSPHPKEAEEYINFLCDPKISAENSKYIGYSTPIAAAKEFLPIEMRENKNLYPDETLLRNAECFTSLPENINKKIDDLWIKVKVGESKNPLSLVFVLLGFAGIYVLVVSYKKQKRDKM